MSKFIVVFSLIVSLLPTMAGFASAQGVATPTSEPSASASPSISPIITANPVGPFIKNIPEADLKQSLSIKEINGSNLCRESSECSFTSDGSYSEVLANSAKITDIGANVVGISIFGYDYSVNIEEAKLVRQYWVESGLDEFSVGDVINVFGYLDQTDSHLIHAKTIRNISLQKRITLFKGIIGSVNNVMNTFVLQTLSHGDQTVAVTSETKIVKSEPVFCIQVVGAHCPATSSVLATINDLSAGDAVVVRGIWNEGSKKITAESVITGFDGRPLFNNINQLQSQIKERAQVETVKESVGIWQKIGNFFDKLRGK
jgi:hypothetical protein